MFRRAHVLSWVRQNGTEDRGSSHELAPYSRLASGRALALRSSPTLPLSSPDAGRRPLSGYAGEPQVCPAVFGCSPVLARQNRFCRAHVPSAAAMDRRSVRLFRPLLSPIYLATT